MWGLSQSGTTAAMTTAVNALSAGGGAPDSAQLARVKTFVAAEIATFSNPKVLVKICGNYDGDGSRITITIQPVSLGPNGEILSVPNS